MKVYVDELPNDCGKCPFNRMTFFWTSNVFEKCKATNECQLGFDGKCELHTLADHDKHVRKEVCQEIRDKMTHWEDCLTKEVTEYVIDKETLEKIEQGETK